MKLNNLILITRTAKACGFEHVRALGVGILAASVDELRWNSHEVELPTINMLFAEDPTETFRIIFQGEVCQEGRERYASWVSVPMSELEPELAVTLAVKCADNLPLRKRLTYRSWGDWQKRYKRIPELQSELILPLEPKLRSKEGEDQLLRLLAPFIKLTDPVYLEWALAPEMSRKAQIGLNLAQRLLIESMELA